jgi:hypothetical protein
MPRGSVRRLSSSSGDGVSSAPPLPHNLADYDVFLVRRARTGGGDNLAQQLAPGALRYGEPTVRAPKAHECHWIEYNRAVSSVDSANLQALVYPARKHRHSADGSSANDAKAVCAVNGMAEAVCLCVTSYTAMVTLVRHKATKTDTIDKTGSNFVDNRRPLPQPPAGEHRVEGGHEFDDFTTHLRASICRRSLGAKISAVRLSKATCYQEEKQTAYVDD